MFDPVLDFDHASKAYLTEKELFLLYSLLQRKSFSTFWSNLFEAKYPSVRLDSEEFNKEDPLSVLSKTLERRDMSRRSSVDIAYLVALGKALDPTGYSISCTADYSLVEGGFLTQSIGDVISELMRSYIKASDEGRKSLEKELDDEQIAFLRDAVNKNKVDGVELERLAHPVIDEYQDAIQDKNADEDFIDLINKLILTPKAGDFDHGGSWDTDDVEQFVEINFRHNRQLLNANVVAGKSAFHEDSQTRLADLFFENGDFRLNIKNTDRLKGFLDEYIQLFQQDSLRGFSQFGLTRTSFSRGLTTPLNRKLFGYKKQKQLLLDHLDETFQEYQRNDLEIGSPYFTPEYNGDLKDGEVKVSVSEVNVDADRFLFVHTMLALEKEGFLKIERFSYGPTEFFDLYDRGFLFHVILNQVGDKTVPTILEGYDRKYQTVKFAGREIELSKKGKETDAVLLFETLYKQKSSDWVHNDEILEDWGYNDVDLKELPKNKIYYAARKINSYFARQTQVEDFIECNTSKARINPKYRKVDE